MQSPSPEEVRQRQAEIRAAEEIADRDREKSVVLGALKDDINTFLWVRLPPTTTLAEAEKIAARWCAEITLLWTPELWLLEPDAHPDR